MSPPATTDVGGGSTAGSRTKRPDQPNRHRLGWQEVKSRQTDPGSWTSSTNTSVPDSVEAEALAEFPHLRTTPAKGANCRTSPASLPGTLASAGDFPFARGVGQGFLYLKLTGDRPPSAEPVAASGSGLRSCEPSWWRRCSRSIPTDGCLAGGSFRRRRSRCPRTRAGSDTLAPARSR
jgi:hypothetical protein